MLIDFTEQEKIRIEKLDTLRSYGINPYPSETFSQSTTIKGIKDNYDRYEGREVKLAGRLMSKRIMGSASFAEIKSFEDDIQLYLQRDSLSPDNDYFSYNIFFKKLLDLGDFIGIEGDVFKTKVGEISIHVNKLTLLSKTLSTLPAVKDDGEKIHYAFTSPEEKYRKRYLDLTLNKDSRDVFKTRIKLMHVMREFLNSKGYYEVETPILQPIYGGAAARPFKTHHNTLDQDLYLRISNELYLKRLIMGGFDGVYEFSKDFRNEGMDRYHNPEFTQIELYVAYKDYIWMMEFVEELLRNVVISLCGQLEIDNNGTTISFEKFERYSMFDIINKYTSIDISTMNEQELRDAIFSEKCEKNLIQPTFITDYPVEMSPLAKQKYGDERFVERFELFINGKESANAFSELNDPLEQYRRFEEELNMARRGDPEAMQMDIDFVRAMMYGMPPTAGVGIGIDRLVMTVTGAKSIQDVIFFPQMKQR